jgi:hypothetical protein
MSIQRVQLLSGPNAAEVRSSEDLVERIDIALHSLCQPLTVLQCRLAMGELIGETEAMREAIREGLLECVRLNELVGVMRAALQQAMQRNENERDR